MKATIPIAMPPNTRVLRLERLLHTEDFGFHVEGTWKLWLSHNLTLTLGTFLLLHDDGSIERVTLREDGTEETFKVKHGD